MRLARDHNITRRRTQSAMPRAIKCTAIRTPRCNKRELLALDLAADSTTPAAEASPAEERHVRRVAPEESKTEAGHHDRLYPGHGHTLDAGVARLLVEPRW